MELKPGSKLVTGKMWWNTCPKLLGTAKVPSLELKQGNKMIEVVSLNVANQASVISYKRGYAVGVVDMALLAGTVWAGRKLYKILTREDKKE